MTELSYPLSILVRAVAFRNLSSASLHVGLSQPQLSRLVARLERELGMELLNRKVKRKSTWTPQAMRLADVFQENQRRLDVSIRSLQSGHRVRQVQIGTLEGLANLGIGFAKRLFDNPGLEVVILDVFDRTELEAKFLAGDLDLIINTRMPSPAKPRFLRTCGYQALDTVERGNEYLLFSSFEYNLRTRPKSAVNSKTLVSNSLSVRRSWIETYGGHGTVPSAVVEKPRKGYDDVYLIGGEWLDSSVWQSL